MSKFRFPCTTGLTVILLSGVFWVRAVIAQDQPVAFVGARVIPIEGREFSDGVVIVHKGSIVALGPRNEIEIPESTAAIDATGRVIMPGLICTHSHIGDIEGADGSSPIQPEIRILDSINIRDSGFRRAVAGGLTTLNIMPGSGHLISGQTVYVKLRPANRIEQRYIRDDQGRPLGGLKMANGTNSRGTPPFPGSRAKSAALIREQYVRAQEYREKRARNPENEKNRPPRNLGMEALVEVLEKRRIVHHHTHRHDDIITVLRLAKEFEFRVVLHHVSEGWKVADEIAEAGMACSVILVDSPGGKLEAIDLSFKTPAVLEQAGVLTAFHTDDWITDSRIFLRMAAMGVRGGMTREGALQGVTLAGATMLDLDKRIGSLVVGKDADFVILDGDPLSVYTKVLETWVEGTKVFDRSIPEDRLYAVGGYGAGSDRPRYRCCINEEERR